MSTEAGRSGRADGANPPRRSRGRPSRSAAQIADVRTRIADCALRLFQQEGYAAVSMRKLAAEAGCTTKTVYAYFDAKIDILATLWSDVFTTLFDRLDTLAAQASDPKARLLAVSQAYVAFWLEHREHYFLVFMSGGLSRAEVEGFVATGMPKARFNLFVRCLADVLGPGADEPMLRQRSEALICSLNGISQALITISGHDWSAPEALVRVAVDGVSGRGGR
jgi:AcrR family transcriptional regulator